MPCQIQFMLTCPEAKPGSHVRAVGNSASLGSWNPREAVPLYARDKFPVWLSEPVDLSDEIEQIEYKYVICADDGTAHAWEDVGNRLFSKPEHGPDAFVMISEAFNEYNLRDEDRFKNMMYLRERHNLMYLRERRDHESSLEYKYSVGKKPMKKGSFGVVHRCQLRDGGATRAVKIVNKSKLSPRDFELLLGAQGELEKHFRLKHKHIVPLYDAFHDRENVSLVMQYCRGGDLHDAVSACKVSHGVGLSEAAAAVAMSHVLLALRYLHSLSIVHRDVKLENVLVFHKDTPIERNILKLCDFGFAAHDSTNSLKDRVGSFHTSGPEVLLGRPYGAKTDLWSAGVLLYMTLSASMPFSGTPKEIVTKVSVAQYSLTCGPWQRISAPAKACVASMLVANPAFRPSAAEVLSQHAWLSSAPVQSIQIAEPGPKSEQGYSHVSKIRALGFRTGDRHLFGLPLLLCCSCLCFLMTFSFLVGSRGKDSLFLCQRARWPPNTSHKDGRLPRRWLGHKEATFRARQILF